MFDTIDHQILIKKLQDQFAIKETALEWFKSFLQNRYFYVKIDEYLSDGRILDCGVPQGSVLGPTLFSLYTQEVHNIVDSYGLHMHMFADDMQIYTVYKGNNSDLSNLTACLNEIKNWSEINFLKLNDAKTKYLHVVPGFSKNVVDNFTPFEKAVVFENVVKNLGFVIDNKLSFSDQVSKVCQFGFYMLHNLYRISSKITIPLKIQLVQSCILSYIDYCNSLYTGLPMKEVQRLQRLMNASVRFIYNLNKRDYDISITYYIKKCHFLLVKYRIEYKVCVLVYKCLQGTAPFYLTEMLSKKESLASLRINSDTMLLSCLHFDKPGYKNARFSSYAPRVWNKLPFALRTISSLPIFKKRLKTHYFNQF